MCDWLNKFYGFPYFQLLCMTPAVNKTEGRGLINTTRHECLPKKTKVTRYRQQKDYSKDRVLQLKR